MSGIKNVGLIVVLCMLLPLLVSCGQKGDLFLPENTVATNNVGQ